MSKSRDELEAERAQYHEHLEAAKRAGRSGQLVEAVTSARAAWPYLLGMIQYERKFESREFDRLPCIDLVLKYAPLLLLKDALDDLDALLKSKRSIDKLASADLAKELQDARSLMWDAHRFWDALERHPGTPQAALRQLLGGQPNRWMGIARQWAELGLVRFENEGGSTRLRLRIPLDEIVPAKCPSCGGITRQRERAMLSAIECPTCHNQVSFVLLRAAPDSPGR